MKVQSLLSLLLPLSLYQICNADVVFENEIIKTEEVFDLKYAMDSTIYAGTQNQSKYYCIFRSNWNKNNHPNDYPDGLARFGEQIIVTHTKEYIPYLKNREAPAGVEKIAEVSFINYYKQTKNRCIFLLSIELLFELLFIDLF